MKSIVTSKEFYIGIATAVALWYVMQYMKARKASSQ